jgi:hypothetical protein
MSDRFYLFASWYDRQEDSQSCAERVLEMLRALSTGHPDLSKWYAEYEDKDPLGFTKDDSDKLIKLFDEGIWRRDDNGERFYGSGYIIDVSNHLEDSRYSTMNIAAGSWRVGYRNNRENNVWLQLPARSPETEGLLTVSALVPALVAIIRAWEPQCAVLGNPDMVDHFKPADRRAPLPFPYGNWMVYLSAPLAALIRPPRSAIIKDVPGYGILLLATEEPFDASNPEHVQYCEAMHAALAPVSEFMDKERY